MISKSRLARMIAGIGQARPRPAMIPFIGGLDQETSPLSLPSGFLRGSVNYECAVQGGYARVMGYERYNGRTAPSAGTASVIDITLTGTIAVGDTVTGSTSAATAVVISVPDSSSIVVTKVSGTFQVETIKVGGVVQATITATPHGASTALLRAQYKNLAADEYRDDIAAPTGSGSSLGGVKFGGVFYTWRNAADGLSTNIWKSSATGWQQVTLFNEVSFTLGGATQPAEGATLTQGAVTATIKRVALTSAATTWATNSATGRLIVTDPAGGNFSAGAATCGAVNFTLSGAQTAITLQPSGRYEFYVENFGGTVATKRIYGCDGVNRGFEFDGTVLVPITTGMTTDAPNYVHVHKKQLFFSFGASVQHSAPATPYVWSVVLGASEIGMGDTVNGFQTQPGSATTGALAIFTRNRTSILYGTGAADWVLVPYRDELGAYAYSIQDVGYTMFLDDQGITNLQTAQEFGNFSHDALSARIKTWVNGKRTKVAASCVCRDKGQYRIFFTDNFALFVTFKGKKVVGMTPMKFGHAATWAWSSEESDGSETLYFGASNGMVYQMEKGTSFDGDAIAHNIKIAWDTLGTPGLIKRFHDATLEITGSGYAQFNFGYKIGYASTDIAQPTSQTETVSFSSGVWDEAGVTWDSGITWDGTTLAPSILPMGGEGENLSLVISGSSDYHSSIQFSGARIMYSPRRYLR